MYLGKFFRNFIYAVPFVLSLYFSGSIDNAMLKDNSIKLDNGIRVYRLKPFDAKNPEKRKPYTVGVFYDKEFKEKYGDEALSKMTEAIEYASEKILGMRNNEALKINRLGEIDTYDDIKDISAMHQYLRYQLPEIGCDISVVFSGQDYTDFNGMWVYNFILVKDRKKDSEFKRTTAHEFSHEFGAEDYNTSTGLDSVKTLMAPLDGNKISMSIDPANRKRIKSYEWKKMYSRKQFSELDKWMRKNKDERAGKLYFLANSTTNLIKEDYEMAMQLYKKISEKYPNDKFIASLKIDESHRRKGSETKKISPEVIAHINKSIDYHYRDDYISAYNEIETAKRLADNEFVLGELKLAEKLYEDMGINGIRLAKKPFK